MPFLTYLPHGKSQSAFTYISLNQHPLRERELTSSLPPIRSFSPSFQRLLQKYDGSRYAPRRPTIVQQPGDRLGKYFIGVLDCCLHPYPVCPFLLLPLFLLLIRLAGLGHDLPTMQHTDTQIRSLSIWTLVEI